jgi:glucose-6-phosphate-specific signal transduction histidine kinase
MFVREERMPRTPISLLGAVQASAAAGPLFVLGVLLGILSDTPAAAIPITLDFSTTNIPAIIVGVPTALVTVMLVGAIIALLPTMIGTAVMTRLGDLNPAFRLQVMWALTGAVACALFVTVNDGRSSATLVALTFTGACCALICRRGVEW